MTDRLPIVDGAPACPFVAFEDDRDGRATAPDHRHRCYAEPRPAPRALAHQEAYCLSSAFPVCPTFQDWARREAAAARPVSPLDDRAARDETPASSPTPARERDARRAPDTETPPPVPPRRPQSRDWAAPPPWSAEDDGRAAGAAGAAAAAAAAGAAGAAAGAPGGTAPGAGPAGPGSADAPAPPFLSPRSSSHEQEWGAAAQGLAGSAAYRLAGPGDDDEAPVPAPTRPSAPPPRAPSAAATDDDALPDDGWVSQPPRDEWPAPSRPAATAAAAGASRRASERRQPPPPTRQQQARRRDERAEELFGPAWEKPRRYEAYPTLRTRMALPSFSNMWIGVAALLFAGIALFFVGPMLLGIGNDSPGTGGGGTPVPSADASASLSPTLPPAPTPQIYVVAKGDNLSAIAKRFDVTVDQILAANPQIKNPNRISAGDEITIPVPVEAATDEAGSSTQP